MGLINVRLTPRIIEDLIAGGHLTGETLVIPLDTKVTCLRLETNKSPLGEMVITLQHENLFRTCEGCEIPFFRLAVNNE